MIIEPIGELCYVVRGLNDPVAMARALSESAPKNLDEAVPCFESLGLFLKYPVNEETVSEWLAAARGAPAPPVREVTIPCQYDGPDLNEVAGRLALSPDEVVRRHSGQSYRCFALGFSPGFPYLGYLDSSLVLPRRDQPRTRVPAGSVAIAGRQTAVYPEATPGGWWLIGTTSLQLVDLAQGYFAVHPGDWVKFEAVDR